MDQSPNQSAATEQAAPVAPAPAPAPSASVEPKSAPYGTVLGIILIVVILVVGAFYVWGARLAEEQQPSTENNSAAGSLDVDLEVPQPQ